jgi:hypothetical protein
VVQQKQHQQAERKGWLLQQCCNADMAIGCFSIRSMVDAQGDSDGAYLHVTVLRGTLLIIKVSYATCRLGVGSLNFGCCVMVYG